MKNFLALICSTIVLLFYTLSCRNSGTLTSSAAKVRPFRNSAGLAKHSWQIDSLFAQIERSGWRKNPDVTWKMVISPHDDYAVVGTLYAELFQNIKAPNLIIIGVAPESDKTGICDSLVFDSYSHWMGPWSDVKVSKLRDEIYDLLAGKFAIVNDTLQKLENSVEAVIPFLQYFNKDINIVPILVPAMGRARTEECGKALAEAIRKVANTHRWEWGHDYALVVIADSIHFDTEPRGSEYISAHDCGNLENKKAGIQNAAIIDTCLKGVITPEKIEVLTSRALQSDTSNKYRRSFYGKYSIPVALYTAYYLDIKDSLSGEQVRFRTGVNSTPANVDDLNMRNEQTVSSCNDEEYTAIGFTSENEKEMGIASLSVINLRRESNHASELISQVILGTPFLVIKSDNSWIEIETPDNYTGWTQLSSVKLFNRREIKAWKESKKVVYLDNTGWLYNDASDESGIVCDLVGGSILKITGEKSGFSRLELPDGRYGYSENKKIIDFNTWKRTTVCSPVAICSTALTYMGIPYLWGGTSTKGADCSGFVQSVFFRNGLILARDASLQALHGYSIDISDGYSRLRKGDLLFFGTNQNGSVHITHAAIYIGNYEYINSAGRVLINSLDSTRTNFSRSRMSTLLIAKRIIGITDYDGIVPVKKHPWY